MEIVQRQQQLSGTMHDRVRVCAVCTPTPLLIKQLIYIRIVRLADNGGGCGSGVFALSAEHPLIKRRVCDDDVVGYYRILYAYVQRVPRDARRK